MVAQVAKKSGLPGGVSLSESADWAAVIVSGLTHVCFSVSSLSKTQSHNNGVRLSLKCATKIGGSGGISGATEKQKRITDSTHRDGTGTTARSAE